MKKKRLTDGDILETPASKRFSPLTCLFVYWPFFACFPSSVQTLKMPIWASMQRIQANNLFDILLSWRLTRIVTQKDRVNMMSSDDEGSTCTV